MESSPHSPLSEMESEDFHEEVPPSAGTRSISGSPYPEARPSKRPRLSASANKADRRVSGHHHHHVAHAAYVEQGDDGSVAAVGVPSDVDISSDTEGSVPGSPHGLHMGMDDEDDKQAAGGREQISVCRWENCEAGDQGNMDLLVKHLHEEHIHARQKKYSCEWIDCPRKGIAHASGYALRAHMRSHTREKPFYCTLPECDRSFTRSDALAKHMRTVHETEALRPSDPVPKHHSSNPLNKSQRLRLTFNKLSAGANNGKDDDATVISNSSRHGKESPSSPPLPTAFDLEYEQNHATFSRDADTGEWIPHFPPDIHFTDTELSLPPKKLYSLLKHQLIWASEESDELEQAQATAERRRKAEWIAKELVLHDVLELGKSRVPDEYPEQLARLKMQDTDAASPGPHLNGHDEEAAAQDEQDEMDEGSVLNATGMDLHAVDAMEAEAEAEADAEADADASAVAAAHET